MRSNNTFLFATIVATVLATTTLQAQFNPGLPAGFGIDGDVLSGQSQNGGLAANGSFDWFKKAGGGPNVGIGVIDTSGGAAIKTTIQSGGNNVFTKGMAFGRYTVQNGYLLLDARYGRDNYGYSNASGQKDFTTYTNGSKNGDMPTTWSTTPGGATVANKADIIDTYIHMRRDGIVINNTNPSALILAMGINTVGNTGDRYIDFELFKTRIAYDQTTGIFSNTGDPLKGAHSTWEFNPNGSVKSLGDMTVSFSYGTAGIQEISVYIWVSKTDHATVNPQRFDFVSGEFYGAGTGANFGYAKIVADGGISFNAWGSVTSATTSAAPWGTNSKSLGGSPTNYFSNDYGANDFGEVAIDLTSLGIDPALSVGADACIPPFTRVMAKTRSSASFTSALQDFTGPYEFLDAPQAPATIAAPAALKCNVSSVTLSPATTIAGAVYTWSTSNGSITSDPSQPTITVNKTGKYYLSSSIVAGCPTNTDSTTVVSDYYKPVASAYTVGAIDLNNLASTANIQGGDVNLSNFATPFGGSNGLTWKWTGPNGYTSTSRNNSVTKVGTYNLELTETRNGCKDVAVTLVPAFQTLPVRLTDFTAVKKDNEKVLLKWNIEGDVPNKVELLKSYNGNSFTTTAVVLPINANKEENYMDNVQDRTGEKVYYKLKITEETGAEVYSKILFVNYGNTTAKDFTLAPNPTRNYTVLNIKSTSATPVMIQLVDMSGRIVQQKLTRVEKGNTQVMLTELEKLKQGFYMVRLTMDGEFSTQKLIIQ